MDNLLLITNHILGAYWIAAFLGVIHLMLIEYRTLVAMVNPEPRTGKNGQPIRRAVKIDDAVRRRLMRRAAFIVGGVFLTLSSWALTRWVLMILLPIDVSPLDPSGAATPMIGLFRQLLNAIGIIGALGFASAGMCLTLSAGQRWLVTTGRLLMTLTVLGLGFIAVMAHIP